MDFSLLRSFNWDSESVDGPVIAKDMKSNRNEQMLAPDLQISARHWPACGDETSK